MADVCPSLFDDLTEATDNYNNCLQAGNTSENEPKLTERRDSSARRLSLVHERLIGKTRNIKGIVDTSKRG